MCVSNLALITNQWLRYQWLMDCHPLQLLRLRIIYHGYCCYCVPGLACGSYTLCTQLCCCRYKTIYRALRKRIDGTWLPTQLRTSSFSHCWRSFLRLYEQLSLWRPGHSTCGGNPVLWLHPVHTLTVGAAWLGIATLLSWGPYLNLVCLKPVLG